MTDLIVLAKQVYRVTKSSRETKTTREVLINTCHGRNQTKAYKCEEKTIRKKQFRILGQHCFGFKKVSFHNINFCHKILFLPVFPDDVYSTHLQNIASTDRVLSFFFSGIELKLVKSK